MRTLPIAFLRVQVIRCKQMKSDALWKRRSIGQRDRKTGYRRRGQHEEAAPTAPNAGGPLRQGVQCRQDVDLSVSAQLRALKEYAKANGYSVAREYVDEAESGRVANRPNSGR